ncbi:molybdenum cofactor biosynthesis protein MoaE [Arthrobacter sp. Marseille-P9274]|uniref:molybdenum cofactor biosynthesis protein MoaE n=1 Tax=Arthrobacter sp. Marseille-P9274 TaxID=2866572 RepID=UPI0021C6FACA|nr:molybdenum cofactor biosynthesis protein MoaE [Arthrobacter sp. Marseille-P9274]
MVSSEVLHAEVTAEPLDVAVAMAAAESAECGAVVTFSGVVRNHDGGQPVAALGYSSHPSAGRVMADVAAEIAQKYDGVRIWVAHRTGALEIGDAALVAAVASAHRASAFAAAAELVDTVKERVPVWKEQRFADGSTEWVGIGQ